MPSAHQRLRKGLIISAAATVAAFGFGIAGPTHVLAGAPSPGTGSAACFDNNGDDIPIWTSGPVYVAIEGFLGGTNDHLALCYSTTQYGYTGPEVTGGEIAVDFNNAGQVDSYTNPQGNIANVSCNPDSNPQGVVLACSAGAGPTYSISPSGCTSGCLLTVNIPFAVCAGQCVNPAATLNPTGLLVGQFQTYSVQSTGEGLRLVGTQVWVNGQEVESFGTNIGGAGIGTINPSDGTTSAGTLCFLGIVCEGVPGGGVEIGLTRNGQPLLEVDLPTGNNEYVSGCVVSFGVPCP